MGTDSHIFVEKRVGDRWISAAEKHKNPMAKWKHEPEYEVDTVDIGRNYQLFTILAGVRASEKEELVPISLPRGLPADMSPEVAAMAARDGDTLGASWLNLSELVEYNSLGFTVTQTYRCPVEVAEQFIETGQLPLEYQRYSPDDLNPNWTTVELEEPVGEATMLNELIDRLRQFGTPEEIRIVFWFD